MSKWEDDPFLYDTFRALLKFVKRNRIAGGHKI